MNFATLRLSVFAFKCCTYIWGQRTNDGYLDTARRLE
jgi:hypothetical protein